MFVAVPWLSEAAQFAALPFLSMEEYLADRKMEADPQLEGETPVAEPGAEAGETPVAEPGAEAEAGETPGAEPGAEAGETCGAEEGPEEEEDEEMDYPVEVD